MYDPSGEPRFPPLELPENPSFLDGDAGIERAYQSCLAFEREAQTSDSLPGLLRARMLGNLIIRAGHVEAQRYIAELINRSTEIPEGFRKLGAGIWKHVFCRVIRHPPTIVMPYERDYLPDIAPENTVFQRDDFRCFITKSIDPVYVQGIPEKETLLSEGYQPSLVVPTKILPSRLKDAAMMNLSSDAEETLTVQHFFKAYGGVDIVQEQNALKGPQNMVVLSYGASELFQALGLWLKEKPNNRWQVRTLHGIDLIPNIIWDTEIVSYYPIFPPDPRYFKLHGVLAEVAFYSALGDEIYRRYVEQENEGTFDALEPDASTPAQAVVISGTFETPPSHQLPKYPSSATGKIEMPQLLRIPSKASLLTRGLSEMQSSLVKKTCQMKAPSLGRSDDIIIAVMGPTGVGKSNFIEKLTGMSKVETQGISSQGLASFTSDIETIRIYGHPKYGSRIVLADTPGFDDTHRSDMEILVLISNWLKARYESGVLLSGIIYLHRISDNRMSGSPARNLKMFGKLCGDSGARRVAFITTMWDRATEPEKLATYENRQNQLKAYWAPMIDQGAQVGKFDNTTDSAWQALSLLLPESRQLPHKRFSLKRTNSLPTPSTPIVTTKDDSDTRSVTLSVKSTSTSTLRMIRDKVSSMEWTRFVHCGAESSPTETIAPSTSFDIAADSVVKKPVPHHGEINSVVFPTDDVKSPSIEALGSAGVLWEAADRVLIAGQPSTTRSTLYLSMSELSNQPPAHLRAPSLPTQVNPPPTCDVTTSPVLSFATAPEQPLSAISSSSRYSQESLPSTVIGSTASSITITPDVNEDEDPNRPGTIDEGDFVLVDAPTTILHVQSELVHEHKRVHETDAAQTLYSGLQAILHENRKNLQALLRQRGAQMDDAVKATLEQNIDALEAQFQETFKEMKGLEVAPWRRVFLRVTPSGLRGKTRALDLGPT
ncbi:hypothetical protein CVT24_000906 [Panaeolus cyanescens]|uniref:G domain-containing protein n=1 Tax=Panaeolus cyanescens TaxID=181874 RepID=A0A409YY24_9AGAR|nr:hypothetical protein CVT24_000906 [Panaeolus cyanescens]